MPSRQGRRKTVFTPHLTTSRAPISSRFPCSRVSARRRRRTSSSEPVCQQVVLSLNTAAWGEVWDWRRCHVDSRCELTLWRSTSPDLSNLCIWRRQARALFSNFLPMTLKWTGTSRARSSIICSCCIGESVIRTRSRLDRVRVESRCPYMVAPERSMDWGRTRGG